MIINYLGFFIFFIYIHQCFQVSTLQLLLVLCLLQSWLFVACVYAKLRKFLYNNGIHLLFFLYMYRYKVFICSQLPVGQISLHLHQVHYGSILHKLIMHFKFLSFHIMIKLSVQSLHFSADPVLQLEFLLQSLVVMPQLQKIILQLKSFYQNREKIIYGSINVVRLFNCSMLDF